jgi:hypothetical protein
VPTAEQGRRHRTLHERAAALLEEAAALHERAAVLFDDHDKPERAERERRAAVPSRPRLRGTAEPRDGCRDLHRLRVGPNRDFGAWS